MPEHTAPIAGSGDQPAQIIVVTGVMAAGKSTVSQLLATRFARGVHLRGDEFRRFVVAGRVDQLPLYSSPELQAEAEQQLRLRHTLAAHAADLYAANGFTVVVQDLFVGASLEPFLEQIRHRPLSVVMLAPDVSTVMRREAERAKKGYGDNWSIPDFDRMVRRDTPRIGLWLDSSHQTPEQTVDEILGRLTEARVD